MVFNKMICKCKNLFKFAKRIGESLKFTRTKLK